jgi:hypothetical protein
MKSATFILTLVALLGACTDSTETPRVQRAVQVDASGLNAVTTDLGYTITLTTARTVIDQITFTRSEVIARSRGPLSWLIGTAHAHPGHGEGGPIVGELTGPFTIDWINDDGRVLGEALLLQGGFDAANFRFGLPADGVSAVLSGTAEKDGEQWPFTVEVELGYIDVEGVIASSSSEGALALQLNLTKPGATDTVFDGIEFATAAMGVGEPDHNRVRRALRSHEFYLVEAR